MPVTITTPAKSDRAPLYHKYPREINAQDAYLEIDTQDDTACWSSDPEIGNAVPMAVWHQLVHRVPCSNCLTGEQIAMLTEELRPLIQRVCDGSDSDWDGHNYIGTLDNDAAEALAEIESRLDPENEEGDAQVWETADWLLGQTNSHRDVLQYAGLTPTSTPEEISAAAADTELDADHDDVVLDGDSVEDLYTQWIAEWREELAEEEKEAPHAWRRRPPHGPGARCHCLSRGDRHL